MTHARIRVHRNTYLDSVILLGATRAMRDVEQVTWANAITGAPANLDALAEEGLSRDDLAEAGPSDLVLAVRAETAEAVEQAFEAGEQALFAPRAEGREEAATPPARTLDEAVAHYPLSNVAVISVPGDYAALEAHKALTAGLHVLLFSDNVSIDEEVELKDRATRLGRLLMGPGAGTAFLGGIGLGFANAVRRGRIGVVAAAGTGAQEVMSLLDRWGIGVSHVIGVGGRDLSETVGGHMAAFAVQALDADPDTDAILLVSKPPDESPARTVLTQSRRKPLVAALIGLGNSAARLPHIRYADTLEQGAARVVEAVGERAPDLTHGLRGHVETAIARLCSSRTLVRGYFSGGTLCSEAQVILTRHLGPVYSNIPLDERFGLPAPDGSHVCLDLGAEEYTKRRPHPMIDPTTRVDILREDVGDTDIAVVLIDVVLGYGSHPDPAGELAPVLADLIEKGPPVVAYVLGTEADPQGYDSQREKLREAGCVVPPTGARAAYTAAAIAARQPELAEALS